MPATPITFITFQGGAQIRHDNYWVGFHGKVANQDLLVSALGRFSLGGDIDSHLVNLLDSSGNLLDQVTVPVSTGTNVMMWQALATPIRLVAGADFYLQVYEQGADAWYNSLNLVFTHTQDASLVWETYLVPGVGTGIPNEGGNGGSTYSSPNFQYTIYVPPPPPPVIQMMVTN